MNRIKSPVGKGLGESILKLYESRKISQVVNAERVIDALKNEGVIAIPKADIFITKNENNESRQDKNKKKKAATKIAKIFKKHIEPKVEYKRIYHEDFKKPKFGFELSLNHSIYNFKSLSEIYPLIKNKLETETKKVLLIKGVENYKMLLGVNSTFIRIRPDDKHEKIKYYWQNKNGEAVGVYEELTRPVSTKTCSGFFIYSYT